MCVQRVCWCLAHRTDVGERGPGGAVLHNSEIFRSENATRNCTRFRIQLLHAARQAEGRLTPRLKKVRLKERRFVFHRNGEARLIPVKSITTRLVEGATSQPSERVQGAGGARARGFPCQKPTRRLSRHRRGVTLTTSRTGRNRGDVCPPAPSAGSSAPSAPELSCELPRSKRTIPAQSRRERSRPR